LVDSLEKLAQAPERPRGKAHMRRLALAQGVLTELAVAAAYTLLTAALTYPLVLNFASALPGDGMDSWHHYHNLWWIKRAVLDLRANPFFTAELHYPYGTHLYYHALLLGPGLLALPVTASLGVTVAYNTIAFLSFVLAGYGAYRLAWYLSQGEAEAGPRRLAAFVAGAAYAFSAFHFQRLLGHLELVSLQWLPFYALFLVKTWRETAWHNPLAAALFMALAALTTWYFALYLAWFTAFFVAYHLLSERGQPGAWPRLGRVGAAALLSGLALAPVLAPMLALGQSAGRVANPAGEVELLSADLLAFFVPSTMHPVWGGWLEPAYRVLMRRGNITEATVFLGYVPLALTAWAAHPAWARRRFWLGAFGLFTLLALGPVLHAAGRAVMLLGQPAPLPYQLLYSLPFGDVARAPARLVVMSTLCLAVLAGSGALKLMVRRGPAGGRWAAAALVAAIVFETAAVPYPMARVEAPPVYAWLARDPRPLAVLEVPIPDDPGVYPWRMFYRTQHAKPVYGGYLSRGLPPLPFSALPGFGQFKSFSNQVEDIVVYAPEHLPAISRYVLAHYRAGYVVIDQSLLSPAQIEQAQAAAESIFAGEPPAYQDQTTLVYAVPALETPPAAFVFLDRGWYGLELSPEDEAARWRWMPEEARLALVTPRAGRWRLALRALAFDQPRDVALWVDGQPAGDLTITPEAGNHVTPPFEAGPGQHELRLASLSGTGAPGGADTRQLSVAVMEIRLVAED
jgi:hypothetical protein